MALQISAIQTAFGNYKKDISDVSSTLFIEWNKYCLGFIWNKLLSVNPDKFFQAQSITTTSGDDTYALSSDFYSLDCVGAGLYPVDTSGNAVNSPLAYTGFASTSPGYYISGGNIVITPVPQQATSYVLRYLPKPPVFTSVNDYWTLDGTSSSTSIIRDQDIEYLIRAIDVQYTAWDEDVPMEGVADQRFVRILSELLDRQRSSPNVYNLYSYWSGF